MKKRWIILLGILVFVIVVLIVLYNGWNSRPNLAERIKSDYIATINLQAPDSPNETSVDLGRYDEDQFNDLATFRNDMGEYVDSMIDTSKSIQAIPVVIADDGTLITPSTSNGTLLVTDANASYTLYVFYHTNQDAYESGCKFTDQLGNFHPLSGYDANTVYSFLSPGLTFEAGEQEPGQYNANLLGGVQVGQIENASSSLVQNNFNDLTPSTYRRIEVAGGVSCTKGGSTTVSAVWHVIIELSK